TYWHLRLALSAMARPVLPRRPAAAPGAALRLASAQQHRDQRLVLFAAASRQLAPLVSRYPTRLRLLGEGAALHHPRAPLARGGEAVGELLRFRRTGAGREAGSDPVAIPAQPQIRPRP